MPTRPSQTLGTSGIACAGSGDYEERDLTVGYFIISENIQPSERRIDLNEPRCLHTSVLGSVNPIETSGRHRSRCRGFTVTFCSPVSSVVLWVGAAMGLRLADMTVATRVQQVTDLAKKRGRGERLLKKRGAG